LLIQLGALGILLFLLERLGRAGQQALELFATQLTSWQQAMIDTATVLETQAQLMGRLCEGQKGSKEAIDAQVACIESLAKQVAGTQSRIARAEIKMREASATHEENAQERHLQIMAMLANCPRCGAQIGGSEINGDEP